MAKDSRYQVPVNGVSAEELGAKLRASHEAVMKQFPPGTGVAVFVFDIGAGGGMGYIANARRADVILALEEWIAGQKRLA